MSLLLLLLDELNATEGGASEGEDVTPSIGNRLRRREIGYMQNGVFVPRPDGPTDYIVLVNPVTSQPWLIQPNSTFADNTVASGVVYSYMAESLGSNGTETLSDWTE